MADEDSSSDWDSLTEPPHSPKMDSNEQVPPCAIGPENSPQKAPSVKGEAVKVPPESGPDTDGDATLKEEKPSVTSSVTVPPPATVPPSATTVPPQPARVESPVWAPMKKAPQPPPPPTGRYSNQPPYDFKDALKDSDSPQPTPTKRLPGKDRKGSNYDPSSPDIPRGHQSGIQSWDDSDAEQNTLLALRQTFEQNRPHSGAGSTSSRDKAVTSTPRKAPLASEERSLDPRLSSGSKLSCGNMSQVPLKEKTSSTASANRAGTHQSPSLHDDRIAVMVIDDGLTRGRQPMMPGSHGDRSHGNERSKRGETKPDFSSGSFRGFPPADDRSVAVYHFEEAHTDYYVTKPDRTMVTMEAYADRAEIAITRGWKELFGVLRIVVTVFTVFIHELTKFLVTYLLRPLVVTSVTILGDRIAKPLFAALFNGIVQPLLILIYNIAVGVRLAAGPLLDLLRGLAQTVATILAAFRLVVINHNHASDPMQRKSLVPVTDTSAC